MALLRRKGFSLRGLHSRLTVGTAAVGLAVMASADRPAAAGSCSPLDDANIVCQDLANPGVDTAQVLTGGGGPVSVTTTDDFGIDNSLSGEDVETTKGALTISGNGGLIFNDTGTDGSPITGLVDGIFAANKGGGALSITTSGTVTGVGRYGVIAANYDGDTSLTISTEEVYGRARGIYAVNLGPGDITITSSGAVTGVESAGIVGISNGGGAVSITAKETVTSEQGPAIAGVTGDLGGSITITAYADVSGKGAGVEVLAGGDGDATVTTMGTVTVTGEFNTAILAGSEGVGSVSITAKGLVTSTDGGGIEGFASKTSVGNVTISATDISASRFGVIGINNGPGDLSISTTGAVTATGVGYDKYGPGIFGQNYNGGAVSITSTGSVHSAGFDAVDVLNDSYGTDTTLTITDASSDAKNAVNVDHQGSGDLTIFVDGAVSGVIGINNVDTYARGGTIVLRQNASVTTTDQNAIVDGDGDTRLSSQGAIVGSVSMNGGDDTVDLLRGSVTGVIDLGDGSNTVNVIGGKLFGTWDDADFSGGFDNNGDQPLNLVGGAGFDTLELFGVTALGDALGAGTGFEQVSLRSSTLIELNSADLSRFGTVFVDETSTLQSVGNSPSDAVVGSLISLGTKDLADGATNDRLTIGGDFVGGFGSILHMDIDLERQEADEFIILGGVRGIVVDGVEAAHEQTAILLEVRGTPVPARQDDLGPMVPLVDVSATGETEPGDFALADGPLHFGGFAEYDLDLAADGIWYLAPDFLSQAYVYESLPGALQTIGAALNGQLVERVGVRDAADVASGVWGRAVGLSLDSEGDLDSTTGASFDQTIGFLQGGGELLVSEGTSGRLLIGGLAHWGTSSLDVSGADGGARGSADADFYGGGLTATWYGAGGLYVDGVVQYTAYDVDIASATRPASAETDGYGVSVSGEAGYRIPVGGAAFLVPQAQLVWQTVDFDDFTDTDGARIGLGDGDSLVGRLGVAFENSAAIGSAQVTGYVEANLLHEFLGDNEVTATSLGEPFTLTQDLGGTSVEVGFGTTVAVSRGVSFFGEVDYTIPFDNGVQGFQAVAGLRWSFGAPPPPPPPAPVVAPVAETAFIVFFDWDRADLTPEANLVLDDVVVVANQSGYASIRLDGYTDLSGSAQYNLGLSERRANSVADGLIARGIAPDEIVIRAFGEENPLVPTPDGVREPQNRRVEIFLS